MAEKKLKKLQIDVNRLEKRYLTDLTDDKYMKLGQKYLDAYSKNKHLTFKFNCKDFGCTPFEYFDDVERLESIVKLLRLQRDLILAYGLAVDRPWSENVRFFRTLDNKPKDPATARELVELAFILDNNW